MLQSLGKSFLGWQLFNLMAANWLWASMVEEVCLCRVVALCFQFLGLFSGL